MTSWLIHRSKQLADTANPEDHKNNEKEYFFKSAQNDIICSLFTDERHSGCGCTVENKSDAQFLKSGQIHNIYFLSLLETFFEIVASGKLTQIAVENHCEYVEFTKM